MLNMTPKTFRKVRAASVLVLIAALALWLLWHFVSPGTPPPPVEEVTP